MLIDIARGKGAGKAHNTFSTHLAEFDRFSLDGNAK